MKNHRYNNLDMLKANRERMAVDKDMRQVMNQFRTITDNALLEHLHGTEDEIQPYPMIVIDRDERKKRIN